MSQQYVSGAFTTVKYDWETSFGTGGTANKPFGWGTKITVNRNNNLERIYGVGSRNSAYTVAKKFEGTMTIDFTLGNGYWLQSVIGDVSDGTAGSLKTHTFAETNNPKTMTITMGTDLGDNDMVTTFTGVVVNSAKITMAVGEAVKVTLDCMYKTESTAFTGTFADVTDTYCDPMTFAFGTITYAGQTMGNTYSGQVQSIELTINNNTELIYGVGSRLTQQRTNKTREYNIRMTYAVTSVANSADVFENFMGDTATPVIPATGNITGVNLVLTLDNGLTTTSQRTLVFTFTAAKTFLNTSAMVFDVGEILKDDVDGFAESLSSCIYSDNTTATP